jgi:hypothetical protein
MHSRRRRYSSFLALGITALLVPASFVACKKTEVMTADGCEAILSNAVTKLAKAEHDVNAHAKCAADSDCRRRRRPRAWWAARGLQSRRANRLRLPSQLRR